MRLVLALLLVVLVLAVVVVAAPRKKGTLNVEAMKESKMKAARELQRRRMGLEDPADKLGAAEKELLRERMREHIRENSKPDSPSAKPKLAERRRRARQAKAQKPE